MTQPRPNSSASSHRQPPGRPSLTHSAPTTPPFCQAFKHTSGPLHVLCFLPGTLLPLPCHHQSILTGPTPHLALNSNLTPRETSSLSSQLTPAILHCNLCFIFLLSSLPGSSLLYSVTLDCQLCEAGAVCPADCSLAERGMHKALSGCVSEEDPGECPGPPATLGWSCPRSRAALSPDRGKKEWARHTQAPRLSMPQAPTCFWSWASLGSSEWMSSPTWAPGRRARCLGSSGQPGGSPCGAHGGGGGIQHQAWPQG